MADSDASQVPCSDMFSFTLTRNAGRNAPRLGKLALKGRKEILTPGFIANTSRGVVPHLTADVQEAHTQIGGVYMALEDCKYTSPAHLAARLAKDDRNSRGKDSAQNTTYISVPRKKWSIEITWLYYAARRLGDCDGPKESATCDWDASDQYERCHYALYLSRVST